jgi:predicted GTPase
VVAICAVRTGCGKSQTTRYMMRLLKKLGKKVVAIRHPMPYGDLAAQAVQRFAKIEDLKKHDCTIEEIEEYEPHIKNGCVVYAGVDYGAILKEAEKEADVILWDGGNNDTPFYKPDLHLVIADPLRAGHEMSYFPGDVNFKMANVIVVNKMDQAKQEDVDSILANKEKVNPKAEVVLADSPLTIADPSAINGKRVLVVEDGPTLTHGGMKIGAGVVAAQANGAKELVDPRPYLVGTLKETFEKYTEIGTLLPAMGYGDQQCADLQATINACDCDLVVIGTPIDLGRIVKIDKPSVRVTYELEEREPKLEELVKKAVNA